MPALSRDRRKQEGLSCPHRETLHWAPSGAIGIKDSRHGPVYGRLVPKMRRPAAVTPVCRHSVPAYIQSRGLPAYSDRISVSAQTRAGRGRIRILSQLPRPTGSLPEDEPYRVFAWSEYMKSRRICEGRGYTDKRLRIRTDRSRGTQGLDIIKRGAIFPKPHRVRGPGSITSCSS